MKRILVVLIMVVLFFGFATNVESAAPIARDGYDLLETCSYVVGDSEKYDQVKRIKASTCMGIITGIRIVNNTEQDLKNHQLFFCIPDDVTNEKLAQVLVDYLESHKEEIIKTPNRIIFPVFKKVFPCKR